MNRILNWLLARAQEKTTWYGFASLLSSISITISPEMQTIIVELGLAVSGLILIWKKGVVRNRVTRAAGLALPGWVMARSGFHRGCEHGPRCWRGSQAAARERPQGPGHPGVGRFGDDQ